MLRPGFNHFILPLIYSLTPSFHPPATNLLSLGLHSSITGTKLAEHIGTGLFAVNTQALFLGGKSSDKQEVLHFQFARRGVNMSEEKK